MQRSQSEDTPSRRATSPGDPRVGSGAVCPDTVFSRKAVKSVESVMRCEALRGGDKASVAGELVAQGLAKAAEGMALEAMWAEAQVWATAVMGEGTQR